MGLFCSKFKTNYCSNEKKLIYIKYYKNFGNYQSLENYKSLRNPANYRLLFVLTHDNYSILEVKKEIEYRHGINANRQIIRFDDIILEDDKLLSQYGINDFDFVLLN